MSYYKIEDSFDKNVINQTDAEWVTYETVDGSLTVSDSTLFEGWSLGDWVNFIFAFYLYLIATVSITLAFV